MTSTDHVVILEVKCDETGLAQLHGTPIEPPAFPRSRDYLGSLRYMRDLTAKAPGLSFLIEWKENLRPADERIPKDLVLAGHVVGKAKFDGFIYDVQGNRTGNFQDFSFTEDHLVFVHMFYRKQTA